MQFEPYRIERRDGEGREIVLCGRTIGPAGGTPVVMLASLGRPGSDFDEVATALAADG